MITSNTKKNLMVKDHPIFLESIRFIRSRLVANDLNYMEKKVLERLVHTSGDFSVQNLVNFSEGACEKGLQALKNGAPILTDTDMAAAAIKICLIHPANLLRLVPNEIEKTLFFKNECIWNRLNFSISLSFNYI